MDNKSDENKTNTEDKSINTKEDDSMNAAGYATLDMNIINNKKSKIISSKEALKDVTPINWEQEVLIGSKKVIITKANDEE